MLHEKTLVPKVGRHEVLTWYNLRCGASDNQSSGNKRCKYISIWPRLRHAVAPVVNIQISRLDLTSGRLLFLGMVTANGNVARC